jgi:hypothetical protein
MYATTLRTPTRMSNERKTEKLQFNPKKLQKAFQKLNKEGEQRREAIGDSLKKIISEADQTARKDVESLRKLVVDAEETVNVISVDEYDEFEDVIVFRDPK